MSNYNLGIDIGGTFIKYALVDENYNVIEKWKKPTVKFESKDEFYDYLCSDIKNIDQVNAIGISAPGLIDQESVVRSYAAPNVIIMYGTNVNEEVSKRTNKKVATINDAKSAGLCELKIGNAKGSKSSAFLIIGTGTGGCLCNENDVIYGHDCFAGEFHNVPFMNLEKRKIEKMGDFSSMTGLIEIYNGKVSKEEALEYGHEVCNKYLAGDEVATAVIEEWTTNMAVQLIAITSFYNPEVICIGGGISEEDWFITKIRDKFKSTCMEYFGADFITTKIERCKYNNDANILGAIINVNMK